MIGKSNYLYRISFVFLCLGLISGIVFYCVEAEQIDTSVTVVASCGVETTSYSGEAGGKTLSLTTTYNTTAQIVIPEGIVATLTYFKIFGHPKDDILDSRSLPSDKNNVGNQVYNITSYLPDGTDVTSFSKSITITLGYNESEISGLDESSLGIYKWDDSQWTVLADSTVDTSANTVTATTTQFSYFTVLGEEEEVTAVCGDGTCNGDETCSSCSTDCGACAPGGGGGGGGGGVLPPTPTVTTKVILTGKASPAAYLTVLKDGRAIGNTQANTQSDFRIEISNITAGVYTFGIWAEDKLGIKSLTFSFTVNVVSGVSTTVSGIFLPPTINLDRDSVKRGETLNISGTTAPQSQVEVHINSDEIIEKLSAGIDGAWFYTFDTSRVAEGTHSIRAKASTKDGLLSTFSQIKLFGVGVSIRPGEMVAAGADLNGDNKVNLIDFSILLYWWGRPSTTSDLNNDGVVNLIDFSIMMYWWTG